MEITISRVLGIKDFMTKIEKEPKIYKETKKLDDNALDIISMKREINGKHFLWNKLLNIKVSKDYDYIGDIINGFAVVRNVNKYGLIKYDGTEVVPPKYDRLESVSDGYCLVAKRTISGTLKYGFINTKGEEFLKTKYVFARSFCEGRAILSIKKDKWTVIGEDRYLKTDKEYDSITDYHEGFAIIGVGKIPNMKYGVIDKDGYEIVKPYYEKIYPFENGYAKVKYAGLWGIINKKGQEVVRPIYTDITFDLDRAIVKKLNNKYSLITLDGKILSKFEYDDIVIYNDKMVRVKRNNLYGFIDIDGNEVLEPKYDMIDDSHFNDEGLCVVMHNDKWGYINKNFEEVIKPIYDDISTPQHGYIRVKLNNKYGLITPDGKVVADPIYNEIKIDKEYITLIHPSSSNPEKDGNSMIILLEEISYDIIIQSENGKIVKKFDTIEEREMYYEILKKEVEKENIKYKNRRDEIERKLIEEEKSDFEILKEKLKNMKSKVM